MAHYYFDTSNGTTTVPDKVGLELDGVEAARRKALGVLTDMARDPRPDGNDRQLVVWVRDEDGQYVLAAKVEVL